VGKYGIMILVKMWENIRVMILVKKSGKIWNGDFSPQIVIIENLFVYEFE